MNRVVTIGDIVLSAVSICVGIGIYYALFNATSTICFADEVFGVLIVPFCVWVTAVLRDRFGGVSA